MAKLNRGESYKGATITKENGEYIITEFTKDATLVYSLSKILDEWLEVDNVSLAIKKDSERPCNIDFDEE